MIDFLEQCSVKLNASNYFFDQLKKFYEPKKLKEDNIPQEVFYFTDACIFELHSAAQMMLQQINITSNTNLLLEDVYWANTGFRKKLEKANKNLFDFWVEIDANGHYHVLEASRNHIAHRGSTLLQGSVGGDGTVQLLNIEPRWRKRDGQYFQNPHGTSIELLDELSAIGEMLESRLKELKEIICWGGGKGIEPGRV